MDRYSNFVINKKQCLTVALAIVADIESYCAEHQDELATFLQKEENERRAGKNEKGN